MLIFVHSTSLVDFFLSYFKLTPVECGRKLILGLEKDVHNCAEGQTMQKYRSYFSCYSHLPAVPPVTRLETIGTSLLCNEYYR